MGSYHNSEWESIEFGWTSEDYMARSMLLENYGNGKYGTVQLGLKTIWIRLLYLEIKGLPFNQNAGIFVRNQEKISLINQHVHLNYLKQNFADPKMLH